MNDVPPEPAPTYLQLRSRILSLDPAEVGLTPSNTAPHVWGVLMETGYAVGTATLVSLADGTTSLYYSTGGGMLGSGEYTPVAEASKALVTQAENHLQQISSNDKFPLPEVGQVRFTFLTYSGIFTTDASEKMLASGNHPLSPLYTLGRETLAQLRLSAEKKRK
jgi:hypothetical protein